MSCSTDTFQHKHEQRHIPTTSTLNSSKGGPLASIRKSSSITDLYVTSDALIDQDEALTAGMRGELDSSTPTDFIAPTTNNNEKLELPRENVSARSTRNFRFALIVLALCLAIFLVALVSSALDADYLPVYR